MTPNDMLASVRELVPDAYIGNTGGNCGAIIVEDSRGFWHILVTTDSGPWATPNDDNLDRGDHDWFVTLWDREDSWMDGAGVRDGDTLTPAESVPHVVSAIVDSVTV